jgi:hypothetical protein
VALTTTKGARDTSRALVFACRVTLPPHPSQSTCGARDSSRAPFFSLFRTTTTTTTAQDVDEEGAACAGAQTSNERASGARDMLEPPGVFTFYILTFYLVINCLILLQLHIGAQHARSVLSPRYNRRSGP